MLSARFIRGVQLNLDYWQHETADLTDEKIRNLNSDFPNLLHLVEMGMTLPTTQEKTINLILQCFFWIEKAGHILQWHPIIEMALQCAPTKNSTSYLRLLKQLGQFQQLQWNFDLAIDTLNQAEILANEQEDKRILSGIYHELCQIHRRQLNYGKAEEYGQKALGFVSKDDTRLHSIILQSLGQCAQEQGDYIQAESYLRGALQLQEASPFVTDKTRTMTALAIVKHKQQQFVGALLMYEKALALLEGTTNHRDRIEILLNQGSLLYSQQKLDEAETVFLKADGMLQTETGLDFFKGLVANNLGCINRDGGHFATAEWYFNKSISLYKIVNEQLFLANAWGNLAKLMAKQMKSEDAIHYYEAALEILEKYPQNDYAREWYTKYENMRLDLQKQL